MISSSHIIIGNIVCDYLKQRYNISLDRQSFVRGNVIPDYSMLGVLEPHFPKRSLDFVKKQVAHLADTYLQSAVIGSGCSLNLGIICHYLTDFFCHAHSIGYKQYIINHVRYEKALHKYLVENKKRILGGLSYYSIDDSSAENINKRLFDLLLEYSIKAEHSFENDITYIIKVCVYAAASIIVCALEQSSAVSAEDEGYDLEMSAAII
jgi:hypothetical protein